eukprot:TRINITY_DN8698_c0_g1_i1.p1 TRINITY_DN8698_c0_g1~~TRINITY_DN8698_c0_g1_i1.p1  ORF type:complete len:353 (-),score=53.47 TRINITY_DN8698_c0_g1_i1:135-1193(-)
MSSQATGLKQRPKDTKKARVSLPRLAPFSVPLDRRLQTASVLFFIILIPVCVIISLLLIINPLAWPFLIPYLIWVFFFDTAPGQGGRPSMRFRKASIWQHFKNYFPIDLIKDEDLDPSRNYIFATHPHGIISIGAFTNFGTEANAISELFPGIRFTLMTLTTNFRIPILRDILMALGICNVNQASCEHILGSGPGRSIVIVVGGATEALDAHPKTYDLTLRKRKGFVKLAFKTGASLVPVLSFGENDVWSQMHNPRGSRVRTMQTWLQTRLGFSTPLLFGRGIFNYDFGVMPRRERIVTVVGKPIHVKRNPNPSDEEVEALSQRYIDSLILLFKKYEARYAPDRKKSIAIVG